MSAPTPTPPIAPRHPHITDLHGERRVDDYAWLRDRENSDVTAYLEAENAYTEAMLAHTKPLQEALYAEMLARIQEDDRTVPVRRGAWLYYSRTETGKAYPMYCRMGEGAGAVEEVILDQNAEAEGKEFYQLGALEVSPDHRLLAILEDVSGYEDFTLRVRDLESGEWLSDRVEKLGFGLAWASDNRTLFYTTTDDAKRSDRVWCHELGASGSDVEVFHDPGVLNNVGVHRARSGAWVVITSSSFTDTEVRLVDAARPQAEPTLVRERRTNVEYDVEPGGDWLYVCTNENAPNFKVMRSPAGNPGAWEEWLPHRREVFVEGVLVFQRFVVVQERQRGLRTLRVTDLASGETHYVEFAQAAYGVHVGSNPEFEQTLLRFTYSSLATPDTVYDYDLGSRQRAELKKEPVLGGFDESHYAVERLEATARDGTMVPISLVYRTPFVRDGSRPLLLYAYGSYGYTMEPTFSSQRVSLLDRGFVFAIAHVRGGQEMGRAWYDDGKMMKKMNTFTDFIDVADHLVRERYTAPERLAANGGSAGGLLMGVIANQRPELFRTIVADVPFVDVVNTMLDASIPLTAQEWLQWGNPNEPEAYACIRAYSPYDNVAAQAYPRLLVTSGVNDSRVAYWEPAKWVAKLRTLNTGSAPILLKMNMGAGHGGASGRYERLRETALRYAFILGQ
ncbi:MAG: S9 family peptidase [Gemmatimonadetes bacterium]|nr:S9 family peptidase [Gemmatimonadota bacterium]